MEIAEGNKLIAEFMGGKYSPVERYSKVGGNTNYEEWHSCETGEVNGNMSHWGFRYHSSWDWIMPVIEKVQRKGGFVMTAGNDVCIKEDSTISANQICFIQWNRSRERNMTKIEVYWLAVIEFIEWFNHQQKK